MLCTQTLPQNKAKKMLIRFEGEPGRGPSLVVGSVLAIEPMLTLGTTRTRILEDGWTVVTTDGSRAAHWEHTVAVTEDGPRILTA